MKIYVFLLTFKDHKGTVKQRVIAAIADNRIEAKHRIENRLLIYNETGYALSRARQLTFKSNIADWIGEKAWLS